jgi:hypothetical protein
MMDRTSLHSLVDTLPEEALAGIERVLQHHQNWPPQPSPDATKLRDQVRERFAQMRERNALRAAQRGIVASFSGTAHVSSEGDASTSMSGWEGDTHVEVKYRVFRGHELEFEERLRMSDDKKSLLYFLSVKGPGKTDSHEVEFDIAS